MKFRESIADPLFCARAAIFGVYLYNSQKLKEAALTAANKSAQERQGLLGVSNTTIKHKVSAAKTRRLPCLHFQSSLYMLQCSKIHLVIILGSQVT